MVKKNCFLTVPSRGGGIVPEKRGVEALFYVLQSEAYNLMLICKCFCQEAVSSRTTKENPNTFPISACNWNFVVFTSFIWLNVYSTFLFSMIYSWQQKKLF